MYAGLWKQLKNAGVPQKKRPSKYITVKPV